jgi:hypothetical protein
MVYEPPEYDEIEREEREARLRLAEARERARLSEGEAPPEHHELLRTLEEEWKRALERLHEIRGDSDG